MTPALDTTWEHSVLALLSRKQRLVLRWSRHLPLDAVLRIDRDAMLSTMTCMRGTWIFGRMQTVFGTTLPLAIVPIGLLADTWSYIVRPGCDPHYTGAVFTAADDEPADPASLLEALRTAICLARLEPQHDRTAAETRSIASTSQRT